MNTQQLEASWTQVWRNLRGQPKFDLISPDVRTHNDHRASVKPELEVDRYRPKVAHRLVLHVSRTRHISWTGSRMGSSV